MPNSPVTSIWFMEQVSKITGLFIFEITLTFQKGEKHKKNRKCSDVCDTKEYINMVLKSHNFSTPMYQLERLI